MALRDRFLAEPSETRDDRAIGGDFINSQLQNDDASIAASLKLKPTWWLYASWVITILLPLQCGWSMIPAVDGDTIPVYDIDWTYLNVIVGAPWCLGCVLGALVAGPAADKIGRKRTLICACGPMIVGAIVQVSSSILEQFVVGRFLAGLASGAVTGTLGCYIHELAPPHLRTPLGIIVQSGIALGVVLSAIGRLYMTFDGGWRLMVSFPILIAVIFLVLAPVYVIESPIWLLLCERREDAVAVAAKLYGDSQAADVIRCIEPKNDAGQPATTFGYETTNQGICSPNLRRPLATVIGIAAMHKLTGIDVIYADSMYFFMFDEIYGYHQRAAVFSIVYAIPCLFSGVLARYIGSRRLLFAGLLGMFVSSIGYAIASNTNTLDDLLSVFSATFIAIFDSTLGPLSWIIIAETCPDHARARMSSIAVSLMWFVNFGLRLGYAYNVTPAGRGEHPGLFVLFPITIALSIVFVCFQVPRKNDSPSKGIETGLAGNHQDSNTAKDTETQPNQHRQQTSNLPGVVSVWTDHELLSVQVRLESIQDIKLIGTGGYGVVYLVRYRKSLLLASKRLRPGAATRALSQKFIEEIKLVAKLEHPHIVKFIGAAWSIEATFKRCSSTWKTATCDRICRT